MRVYLRRKDENTHVVSLNRDAANARGVEHHLRIFFGDHVAARIFQRHAHEICGLDPGVKPVDPSLCDRRDHHDRFSEQDEQHSKK